jgi:hypothetical protein
MTATTQSPMSLTERKRVLTARLLALEQGLLSAAAIVRGLREDAENLDVTSVEPVLSLPGRKGRYKIKVSALELQLRQTLWAEWVRLRTAEAIERLKWRRGQRTLWSDEACAEHLGLSDHTQLSRWRHGRLSVRSRIEQLLRADVRRMKLAGIQPVLG